MGRVVWKVALENVGEGKEVKLDGDQAACDQPEHLSEQEEGWKPYAATCWNSLMFVRPWRTKPSACKMKKTRTITDRLKVMLDK